MKKESHSKTNRPTPHHSAAVEHVAREIWIWGLTVAAICTIIVMAV